MSRENKWTIFWCVLLVLILIAVPLIMLRGAEFGGSDDKGSEVVSEIQGEEYEPWFTPVMEVFLGDEIPGEIESLFFCLQTGIGVGIIAFMLGKWSERYRLVASKNSEELYRHYRAEYLEDETKRK